MTKRTPAEVATRNVAATKEVVEGHRSQLVTLLGSGTTGWDSAAVALAKAEGEYGVWVHVHAILTHEDATDEQRLAQVQRWAMDLLLRGADDSWSGRGNDVARARFDGTRKALEGVIGRIRHGW